MKQAVIFAGAPVQPELQPPVPQADLYLCADAGVRLAQALGIVPDRIMGDFDSLGDVPAGENVEAFSPEKDDTDILLAAKYALSAGCSRLIFYGALGGRLDHMVANLQMLRFLADRNAQGILVDHAHWITTAAWRNGIVSQTGGHVLFSVCHDGTVRRCHAGGCGVPAVSRGIFQRVSAGCQQRDPRRNGKGDCGQGRSAGDVCERLMRQIRFVATFGKPVEGNPFEKGFSLKLPSENFTLFL